jgi:nucleotide-binding universal stress UspA family protein
VIAIRTILAPTDLSRHAEVAVRYACGLSERLGATLHLLHVLPDPIPIEPDPLLTPPMPIEYDPRVDVESFEALRKSLDPAWGQPAGVEVAVRHGSPVESVVAYAEEKAIDLIVIATHGRTGLSHALLGSVAEQIVREAPCPVLTIRDRAT